MCSLFDGRDIEVPGTSMSSCQLSFAVCRLTAHSGGQRITALSYVGAPVLHTLCTYASSAHLQARYLWYSGGNRRDSQHV